MRQYTVFLTPDVEEGGYTVRVPVLPGCNTQGDTLADALLNAQEAIELYLEMLKDLGELIPKESVHPQAIIVSVAAKGEMLAVTAPVPCRGPAWRLD